MPDLSKIKLNDTTYDLKDAVARFIDIPLTLTYDSEEDSYDLTYTGSNIAEISLPNARLIVTCPDTTTKVFYRMVNNYNAFSSLDANDSLGLSTITYNDNEFNFAYIDIMSLIDYNTFSRSFMRYGVCSTAADTVAKTVEIQGIDLLYEGLFIFVKFNNTNSVSNPTLQVNSLTAKSIKRYGTTAPSTSAASSWNAGSVQLLVYDGTYWQMTDWDNTTYSSMTDAEITAGTSTSNRLITPARLKTAITTWAPTVIPTNVSAFTNDAGYLTSYTETDPTVPDWAKASTKPTYTASEVGALPDNTVIPAKIQDLIQQNIFGVGYLDCSNSNRYICVSGVNFSYAGSSEYSSPFLFMFINGTARIESVSSIAGSGSFRFYDIATNSTNSYRAGASFDISPTTEVAKYGVVYLAYLYDGVLKLYPLSTLNDVNTAISKINAIITTTGENNTEYNLIGTATSNTNTSAVNIYNPSSISFAKTTTEGRLTLGSNSLPGKIRLYSNVTNATGYTDLISGATSTNTRTITFPDATGTVALTSDIPSIQSWALAASKPSYTFSELTSHPTSIGGYGIIDAYTKTEVDGMISGVLHYKGTKATISALPSSENTIGDVWHITADGSEYAWDGSDWQELGTAVDLSGYVPTSRTVNGKALSSDISLTASDVSALPSNTTYVSSFNGDTGAITYTAPVTSVNGQTGAVTLTDSDEKVKYTDLNGMNSGKPLLIANEMIGSGVSATNTAYASNKLMWNDYSGVLYVYNSDRTKSINISGHSSHISFPDVNSSYIGVLKVGTLTQARNYTLPNASGTLALTSDIPTVPDISGKVNKSGDAMTGDLSFSDSKGIAFIIDSSEALDIPERTIKFRKVGQDGAGNSAYTRFKFITTPATQQQAIRIDGVNTPTGTSSDYDTYIASKKYVDDLVSAISIPQPYNVSTNPTGYLTINDLPLYDGSSSNPT